MQIPAINVRNNMPSFGEIYQSSNVIFTPKQKETIEDITTMLRTPMAQFDNKTPEEYYKTKNNIDFSIENHNQHIDTVLLEGYFNARELNDGAVQKVVYRDSFSIGIYDTTHKFYVNDIKTGLEGHKQKEKSILKRLLFPVACFATLAGFYINKISTPQQTEPLIKTNKYVTDSDSVKTILHDTSKLNTKVWKIIKK